MDFKPRGRFLFLIIGYKESTSGSPKPSLIPIMGSRDWARRSIHQGFHNGPGRSPLFKTERAQGLFPKTQSLPDHGCQRLGLPVQRTFPHRSIPPGTSQRPPGDHRFSRRVTPQDFRRLSVPKLPKASSSQSRPLSHSTHRHLAVSGERAGNWKKQNFRKPSRGTETTGSATTPLS